MRESVDFNWLKNIYTGLTLTDIQPSESEFVDCVLFSDIAFSNIERDLQILNNLSRSKNPIFVDFKSLNQDYKAALEDLGKVRVSIRHLLSTPSIPLDEQINWGENVIAHWAASWSYQNRPQKLKVINSFYYGAIIVFMDGVKRDDAYTLYVTNKESNTQCVKIEVKTIKDVLNLYLKVAEVVKICACLEIKDNILF